jgi:hypothetical protein
LFFHLFSKDTGILLSNLFIVTHRVWLLICLCLETCRDKIVYAKLGDWEDLKKKMIQLLKNPPKENLRKGIEDIAKLERFSDRLTQILEDG